jgi:small subunit ribosomal protein S16
VPYRAQVGVWSDCKSLEHPPMKGQLSGLQVVRRRRAGTLTSRKGQNSVLMIRLSRRGARKQPHYRIVVIEKDRARDGRSVEVVGTYNPRTNPASIVLKRERVDYWVSKGAQLSDRVRKIVEKAPATPAASAQPITPASAAEPPSPAVA